MTTDVGDATRAEVKARAHRVIKAMYPAWICDVAVLKVAVLEASPPILLYERVKSVVAAVLGDFLHYLVDAPHARPTTRGLSLAIRTVTGTCGAVPEPSCLLDDVRFPAVPRGGRGWWFG